MSGVASRHTSAFHPINSSRCLNSLIKVAPYVLGVDPWGPGAPKPRMYPRSGYFLVIVKSLNPSKAAYLNLSEYFDQEKIAQKIILLALIQVEAFLNLK